MHLRKCWAERVAARIGGREAAFAVSFLLGRRAARLATREELPSLRRAGVGHLLAVSGLHVGLVAGGLALLLAVVPVGRRARWLLLAGALLAYGSLVGWSASIGRAASVGALWCAFRATGRHGRALTFLLFVLSVSLWAQPGCWRAAGFQLSYLVSAALLGAFSQRAPRGQNEVRERAWTGGRKRGRALIAREALRSLRALLAAQVTAWPLILEHFGCASVFFLMSNALLVPLAGLLMPVLAVSLALGHLPGFPVDIALAPAQEAIRLFLALTEQAARVCDAARLAAPIPRHVGLLAAVLVAVGMSLGRVRLPVRLLLAITIAGAATLVGLRARVTPTFFMLDVGQGESWVLLWEHETWVIDLGPEPGTADRPWRCLEQTLDFLGRSRIDRLFLTHADRDHVGGRTELLDGRIGIGILHHPSGWRPPAPLLRWVERLEEEGTRVEALLCGDTLRIDGSRLTVLNPPPGTTEIADGNEGSLAFLVEVDGLRLLISGDVPSHIQQDWVDSSLIAGVDVLSAAHHGSAGSTPAALLTALRPDALVISVGRRNPFGHPSLELLDRIRRFGAPILRTDRDGTLQLQPLRSGWRLRGCSSGRTLVVGDGHAAPHPAAGEHLPRASLERRASACY
jgi:competence protein ComEC